MTTNGKVPLNWEDLGYWPGWVDNKFPPYWEALRRFVFRRDKYTCQVCGHRFGAKGLDAHHIIPWQDGGVDSCRNLITLCEPCHDTVHLGPAIETEAEPAVIAEVPTDRARPLPYDPNAALYDGWWVVELRHATRRKVNEANKAKARKHLTCKYWRPIGTRSAICRRLGSELGSGRWYVKWGVGWVHSRDRRKPLILAEVCPSCGLYRPRSERSL